MALKRAILLIMGAVLFALFLYHARIRNAVDSIALVRPFWFLIIITMNLCVPLLKMLRWQAILSRFGISLSGTQTFGATSAGFFLGLVTPGTSGELGRAITVNMDKTIGVGTVLFEKIFDLIVLLMIAISALAIHYFAQAMSSLTLIFLWSGLLFLLLILSKKNVTVERWVRSLSQNILLRRWRAKVTGIQNILNSLSKDFSLSVRCVLYSLFLWVVPGVQFYFITKSLGIDASVEMVAASFFVPYLAGILSLVPLGLGVADFSITGVMTNWYGISHTIGNASVIAFRLLVTFALVIWGFGWYCYMILGRTCYKGVKLPDQASKAKEL